MAKGGSRQKKKAKTRAARDIQTPAPTDGGSEPESPQAEGSRARESRSQADQDKGKSPDQRTRYGRSPTREGDFAPNASDHESNDQTDIELNDASDQDAPVENKPSPLSRWVKEVIRKETENQMRIVR